MAESAAAFNQASYLDAHNSRCSPYYMEIRDYHFEKDGLRKKRGKSQMKSHSQPRPNFSPYSLPPQRRVHDSHNRGHVVWKTCGLNRAGSLEYEDIYNRQQYRDHMPSGIARHGRHSFREGSSGKHRIIEDYLRDTRGLLGLQQDRDIVRQISRTRTMEETSIGGVEDGRYAGNMKDFRDTTYSGEPNVTNSTRNEDKRDIEEEIRRARQTSFPRDQEVRGSGKHSRNWAVKNGGGMEPQWENEDDVKRSNTAGEIRIARQTSFHLRKTEQKTATGQLNSRAQRNDFNDFNDSRTHSDVDSSPSHLRASSPDEFVPNKPTQNARAKIPPPVAPKPIRPRQQMTRSASPAPSSLSSVSYAGSQATQKSATSKISVKSILKKPKVGRVVLKAEPPSFTVFAVLSCILCFPFGIYAFVKSEQVKTAVQENDYESALHYSKKVKSFCIGVTIAYLGIFAIAGAFFAKYRITGELF